MPFEADKWQIKHDKTSIQLQVFPNRQAIRAQILWRNVETVETRVALPSLVGKGACAVVLGASPIQLLPFSPCWASQVSDLGLTS